MRMSFDRRTTRSRRSLGYQGYLGIWQSEQFEEGPILSLDSYRRE